MPERCLVKEHVKYHYFALFGSELWILSNRCMDLIETFQVYAGKGVQRLFNLVPNSGAFFSLGWLRLVRLVEVKKLLFVRAILVLDVTEPSRRVFCRRFEDYMAAPVTSRENVYGSVVFDLVNVAVLFGLLDDVCNMVAFGLYVVKRCVEKQSVGDGCLLLVCGSYMSSYAGRSCAQFSDWLWPWTLLQHRYRA